MAKKSVVARLEQERVARDAQRRQLEEERRKRRIHGQRRRRGGGHWRPAYDTTRPLAPRVVDEPDDERSEPPAPKKAAAAVAAPAPVRPTGRSPQLARFIQMNGESEFNIVQLNAMDFAELLREAGGDRAAVAEILDDFDQITGRVRDELSDAPSAGALLRSMTAEWLRESPADRGWEKKASQRWGGLFAETRVPGGTLTPPLTERLARFHAKVLATDTRPGHRVRKVLAAREGAHDGGGKDLLRARAAQAYLDDLAASPARLGEAVPLPRLAELAQAAGVEKVTAVLRLLFTSDAGDSIAVLHPARYPNLPLVSLRPPSPQSRSAFVAYTITFTPPASAATSTPSAPAIAVTLAVPPDALWERPEVSADDWGDILRGLAAGKGHLDVPPLQSYRDNAPYLALRQLVLDDPEAARLFLAVRWKGKPTGLSFVAQLSSEGSYSPEYETDPAYLESELGHAVKGDPDFVPADGAWVVRGMRITRTLAGPGEVRYAAQRVDPE